jgi:hypothetical protein
MSSLIFNNYLENSNDTSKKISEFLDKKDLYIPNIFNVINTIPRYKIIYYIFIVLLIYAFFRDRTIRLNEIFIFLVSVILIYFLIQKDYINFIQFTDNKKIQMKFLEKMMFSTNNYEKEIIGGESLTLNDYTTGKSYLYYDSIIVEFYYNIRDFINYDISSYINSLKSTNNLLKISFQSKNLKQRLKENYEEAIIEKNKALNYLSYSTFTIPIHDNSYKKYKESINILHQRLNAHIDNMSILFKDITVERNKNDLYYLPKDVFEKDNDVQPNNLVLNNSSLVSNLY